MYCVYLYCAKDCFAQIVKIYNLITNMVDISANLPCDNLSSIIQTNTMDQTLLKGRIIYCVLTILCFIQNEAN